MKYANTNIVIERIKEIVNSYENVARDEAEVLMQNSLKQIARIEEQAPQKNALLMLEQAMMCKNRASSNVEALLYNIRLYANLSLSNLADVFAAYDGSGSKSSRISPEDIQNSQLNISGLIIKRIGKKSAPDAYKKGVNLLLIIAGILGLRRSYMNDLIDRLFLTTHPPWDGWCPNERGDCTCSTLGKRYGTDFSKGLHKALDEIEDFV